MTDLILTEKHSVAADFAKALGVKKKAEGCFEGNGYVITWAVGHLVSLCDPEEYDPGLKKWTLATLPLIPPAFEYKPIKRTYKQFKIIKELLIRRSFERVIIATDAGREGEVIARTILLKAGFLDKARVMRFWTSQALVPEVVRQAMENLRPMSAYDRLWRAGYYRQAADWLIGMNCTRVLTVRLNDLFSVGRVQTAVLALLADRKRLRDEFIPEPYWTLNIVFANEKGRWTGTWFKNKETRLTDPEKARALYESLTRETGPATVESVTKEKKRELPPFLFSLTDLQQEANKRFGFPAKKTLNLAQSLYQDKKCLSYPRTDSRVLGTQNLDMVRSILGKFSTALPDIFSGVEARRVSLTNRRVFNDAKLTDHHALIPLKPLTAKASSDEKRLFDLVVRRFAAAFHGDCRFENTRVVTGFGSETFLTRGKVILEKGWREVTGENKKEKESQGHLPPLVQGDQGTAEKISQEEKLTQPPPDYTDSLLLKDMTNPGRYVSEEAIKKLFRGDVGIGTQSTRAQIIETLVTRKYIARAGKKLKATEKGCFLVDTLRNCPVSSVLTSPEETARWEMNLNRIALGDQTDAQFLNNIKDFVRRSVAELKTAPFDAGKFKSDQSVNKKSKKPPKPHARPLAGLACPVCGGEIIEGKKGVGCANWRPEKGGCRFVIWKRIRGKTLTIKNMATLLSGKTTRAYVLKADNGQKFKGKLVMTQLPGSGAVIRIIPKEESIPDIPPVPCTR